jgi:hypothetical protein
VKSERWRGPPELLHKLETGEGRRVIRGSQGVVEYKSLAISDRWQRGPAFYFSLFTFQQIFRERGWSYDFLQRGSCERGFG